MNQMLNAQNSDTTEQIRAASGEEPQGPPSDAACPIRSKIGGQALIEGVMMRGIGTAAMAVRLPDGTIDVEQWALNPSAFMRVITKIPVVRGIFSFISSMIEGYKCLSKSAEKAYGDDEGEELSKFEQWLERKFGDHLMGIITGIGTVLGVVLAIGLFIFIPTLLVKGLDWLVPLGGWKGLIEGAIKMAILIGYLAAVSRMKEIKRVFEYHGAEHKTIFCYEKGLPLTVENVRVQSRFHPRCGTSFLILMLIVSVLVFSVVTWDSVVIRSLLKLAMLPLVMGIGYELLKLCGRYDNWLTKIIAWPGLRLQRLTTREPDDSQIEVAIASLEPVIPQNRADDRW